MAERRYKPVVFHYCLWVALFVVALSTAIFAVVRWTPGVSFATDHKEDATPGAQIIKSRMEEFHRFHEYVVTVQMPTWVDATTIGLLLLGVAIVVVVTVALTRRKRRES